MPEPQPVTALQLELLRVLWDRGASTVADVHAVLGGRRRLALTTVGTLLARLEKRGLVERLGAARPFAYRASVAESELREARVSELTEQHFAGDASRLVMHLLERGELSREELARVRALLEDAAGGEPPADDEEETR